MNWPDITTITQSVKSGEVTALTNVNKAIEALENSADYQHTIAIIKDRSIERAKIIDGLIQAGEQPGSLAGVPFVAKDNFLVFGANTTAASNMLKAFDTPYQATAIEKLEAAGAICVAKTNLDAFAHGSSTENSDFMITKNPHDKSYVPGGSSGGSAVAVALDAIPFALGTDTGGSIRLPASYCGIVGYKPTYGLISRNGVIAMASSTDCIGPLTKTVSDAAKVINVMAGLDPQDSTTIERELSYELPDDNTDLKGLKIGLVSEFMGVGLSQPVRQAVETAISKLKSSGAEIINISLPSIELALAVYYVIVPAEISSNLSRYDGQRFGNHDDQAQSLEDSYLNSRSRGFGPEAKRRIMIGTYVLSSGYYDAYYKKAQTVRTKLIKDFENAFESVNLLIGATAPETAFKIGEHAKDPLAMYLTDIMTVSANLVGVPAISLPIDSNGGMPIGLQLIAPQRQDAHLLGIAKSIEEVVK